MLPLTQALWLSSWLDRHEDWHWFISTHKSAKFWCRGEKIKLLSLWNRFPALEKNFSPSLNSKPTSDKAHKSDHKSYLCLNVVHWLCAELSDHCYMSRVNQLHMGLLKFNLNVFICKFITGQSIWSNISLFILLKCMCVGKLLNVARVLVHFKLCSSVCKAFAFHNTDQLINWSIHQ